MSILLDLDTRQKNDEENIFDQFLTEIESLKSKNFYDIKGLGLLENVILSIERVLQDLVLKLIDGRDFNSEDSRIAKNVKNAVEYLLINWFEIFNILEDYSISKVLAYNLLPSINLIQNYTDAKDNFKRYILCLYPPRGYRYYSVNGDSKAASYRQLFDSSKSKNLVEVINKLDDNYKNNVFQIPDFDKFLYNNNIEEFINLAEGFNTLQVFEDFITGDDLDWDFIWDFQISFYDNTEFYSAVDISYFLWTFSKTIESVGDVEVLISRWYNGSRVIELQSRIKTLSAKLELKNILDKFVKSLEAFYLRKPISELYKIEAETEKIQVETHLLKKQLNAVDDSNMNELKEMIDVKRQLLELEDLELSLREKRLAIQEREKLINDANENLMFNGAIQIKSDFEILLNEAMLISIRGQHSRIKGEGVEVAEVDERKVAKKNNDG